MVSRHTLPVLLMSIVFFEKQWFGKLKSCSVVGEGEKLLYTGKSGKKIKTRTQDSRSLSLLSLLLSSLPLSLLQLSLLDKSITPAMGMFLVH